MVAQRHDENSVMGRLDYQISDRTTLFGRYNGNNALISDPGGMRPEYIDTEDQYTKNLMLQLQHTFSPSVVNETRVGVHRVPRIEEDFGAFVETINVPGLTALPNSGGTEGDGNQLFVHQQPERVQGAAQPEVRGRGAPRPRQRVVDRFPIRHLRDGQRLRAATRWIR